MVTDYLKQCGYTINKLKNHIYLFESNKYISIDHKDAFISGATATPIYIKGFNVEFSENTSLDERYKFTKTLKISINGRLNKNDFPDKIYAVIENEDGTYFFTNPDFPYKLTYSFNLSNGTNQTDITLTCNSNIPVLNLHTNKLSETNECKSYVHNGIKSLKLLENTKVKVSTVSDEIITTEDWKVVEYLNNTCSLQENYDGNRITTTIQFNISLSNYKSDWQYKLLEFKDNRYTAVVESKDGYKYYAGYLSGLEANYSVSEAITITLTEVSNYGIEAIQNLEEEKDETTKWVYVNNIPNYGKTYECYGLGFARFFMMEEVDAFGNSTCKYKMLKDDWDCLQEQDDYCLEKYGKFLSLNIVGTFDDVPIASANTNYFPTSECAIPDPSNNCVITSDLPTVINFTSTTTYSYNFKASCNWSIVSAPSYLTVSPSSGVAESSYTLSVTNSLTPTETASVGTIVLTCCNTTKNIQINVVEEQSCIYPEVQYINCLSQPVQFTYQGTCPVEISAVTKDGSTVRFDGSVSNNQVIINIPANLTNEYVTYKLYLKNCGCSSGITEATIEQRRQFEMWQANCVDNEDVTTCDYVCESGNSYVKEYRYTGTTTGDWTQTGEYRAGTLIQSGSTNCNRQTRFQFLGNYTCVDGSKYELLEEQESTDGGTTWNTTGVVRLGDWVEDDSTFCQNVSYEWILTENFLCLDLD